MGIEEESDKPARLTKDDIREAKKALLEEGLEPVDFDALRKQVEQEHNFNVEKVVVKPLSDDELMYGFIGYNRCTDCDQRHPYGIVLDSNGQVIRRLKPEYAERWMEA